MSRVRTFAMAAVFGALTAGGGAYAADEIVVGFATAESGFMQAYDKPAQDAALIRIDEINKAGGLLGKQIKVVTADTKTDRAEGAKAGLEVLDKGAELVIVSCDYDFGSPAARICLMAETAPGIMVQSMIASGSCGSALMRLICEAMEASSFLNVSLPTSSASFSLGNCQSKPSQMPLL